MMHPTGRVIFESPHIKEFLSIGLGTELIYSLVIIVCSLMIYFGTKELYELSEHNGIKYFRFAFLFFAIAYFFRSFIKLILMYFNIGMILDLPPQTFGLITGPVTLFLFMYFSSMAIFYLLYSVMWKKWRESPKRVYLFHFLAFVISLAIIFTRNAFLYLGINLSLFLIVLATVIISRRNKKKKRKSKHNLYGIYLLLSFFWILNIIDILIPDFFQMFKMFVYIASLIIFLLMLYKVLKKAGSD